MAFPDPPSLLDEWGLLFQTGSLNASFSEASEPEQGIIDWPFEEEVSMSTSTIAQPYSRKKLAGSPMTKNSTQGHASTFNREAYAADLRDHKTFRPRKKPPVPAPDEGIELIRLLRLHDAESHKITSLTQQTKIARGVQESICEKLRTRLSPVQLTLQEEIVEQEVELESWQRKQENDRAQLEAAEAAVMLARKQAKTVAKEVRDAQMSLGSKKEMQALMKRFGDGEELDEGEMVKVLVIYRGSF